MERLLVGVAIVTLFCGGVLGQSARKIPVFEAADVHPRPPDPFMSARGDSLMSGGLLPGGRYELHTASMADLIRTAYDLEPYALFGGPPWLETDHFEIVAKTAPGTAPADLKLMLQDLLADRFKLVVRNANEPIDVSALTVSRKGVLKVSEGETPGGCKFNETGNGVAMECHHVTMAELARTTSSPTRPTIDLTGLKGSYDFKLQWTGISRPGTPNADAGPYITLAEALDKQLGLKLIEQKHPMPVLVLESVNRTPTPNVAGVEKLLGVPTEFEVASVKPSRPGNPARKFQLQRGRLVVENVPLKTLIAISQNLFPIMAVAQSGSDFEVNFERVMIVGGPKWIESTNVDIVAKIEDASPYTPQFLSDSVMVMLRSLLADRFKLAFHKEERSVPVWALVVGKGGPKLTPADPRSRSGCKPSGGEVRTGSAAAPVLIQTCRNVTMAQLADSLHAMARAYVDRAGVDMTGLKGGYDFTLTWMGINVFNSLRAQGQGVGGAVPEASNTGGISMFDALEKLGLKLESRRAPQSVIVIDRIEPLTEN
jgi:uncharacterized protein (TIGR03435 family)